MLKKGLAPTSSYKREKDLEKYHFGAENDVLTMQKEAREEDKIGSRRIKSDKKIEKDQ